MTSVVTRRSQVNWQPVAGVLIAVAAAITATFMWGHLYWGTDLEVYHGGGWSILHGTSPYDFTASYNQLFIYTPFAAVVFVPLGWMSHSAAMGVWTLISVLCLEATIWLVLGYLGGLTRSRRATWTVVATLAALALSPVFFEVWVGQIELILMFLVVADLTRKSDRWRGFGIGIAAGLKLTPLIFIAYLLLTRRFRAAGNAAAGFVATILVGFAVIPSASWSYWHGTFFDISRMLPDNNQILNQSIHGFLDRLPSQATHGTGPWLLVGVLVGLAGLSLAVWASRRGEELTGILACAITGLLVSPLSWEHHWVWCVPVVILCFHRAWRTPGILPKVGAVAVWLAFASGTPVKFTTLDSVIFLNQLIAIGLILLITLALLLWRHDRRTTLPAVAAHPTRSDPDTPEQRLAS
jgi:alpha-1,2-mannosyltransferase